MTPEKPQNYWQDEEANSPTTAPVPAQPDLPMTEPTPFNQEVVEEPVVPENEPMVTDANISDEPITWSAEEYVHAEKGPLWFIGFIIIVLGFVAIDVFFLRSWTFSALVIVMAVTLAIYIRRPARTLTYALSPQQGLYVGEKLYSFEEFKSFGIIEDQGNFSVMLIPRKRFAPGVSVFFPENAGERIVDILGQRLPMENLKLDFVDILVRKLRL